MNYRIVDGSFSVHLIKTPPLAEIFLFCLCAMVLAGFYLQSLLSSRHLWLIRRKVNQHLGYTRGLQFPYGKMDSPISDPASLPPSIWPHPLIPLKQEVDILQPDYLQNWTLLHNIFRKFQRVMSTLRRLFSNNNL